jgi:hypothetical protein
LTSSPKSWTPPCGKSKKPLAIWAAQLAMLIRNSPMVNAGETSWWVGGPGHWLRVFTNPKLTFNLVDQSTFATGASFRTRGL